VADKRSPELDLDDIFRRIEQTALSNHPNPDRIGCFSEETLTAFAVDPRSFSVRDPIFEHLARCSECFKFVHARRVAK
jgi:hypothetical protein